MQELCQLPETVLFKDMDVRWNTSFKMLNRFYDNRSAVQAFLLQTTSKNYPAFQDGDWLLMEQIIKVLSPIAKQYDLLQARNTSVAYVLPVYKLVLLHLNKNQSQLAQAIKDGLVKRMDQCKFYLFF